MTPSRCTVWMLVSLLCAARPADAGIDSQARAVVATVPPLVEQVFTCGTWSASGQRGHFRVVLATVSHGAGTEVYVQRIVESVEASNQILELLSTTPIRELNNDHAQYQVLRARCVADRTVALVATFEHDEGDVVHRIKLTLKADGSYALTEAVVGATKARSGPGRHRP